MKRKKKIIFTLVELLIVIAIIAILAALFLPSLQKAKQRTKQIQCYSGLKQIGIGFAEYANDYDGWVAPGGGLWFNLLRTYLNLEGNLKVDNEKTCGIFKCPGWELMSGSPNYPGWSYVINYHVAGEGTASTLKYQKRFSLISNPGSIVLIADGANNTTSRTPSRNYTHDGTSSYVYAFSKRHLGRTNILFCDLHTGNREWIYKDDLGLW